MAKIEKIALFPLGLVMLPDMLLPLHIFEERYKQMIAGCLESGAPFGIVMFDGQGIRQIGCMAHITQVLKRYEDGRMDIMTQGGKRFVVKALVEARVYMEARVLFFDDAIADSSHDNLKAMADTALKLVRKVVEADIGTTAFDAGNIDPKRLAYAIAALEGFSPAERQRFLEMTSPFERLDKCIQVLSRLVARNRLTREIRQMIGGNGNPTQIILRALEEPAGDD